MVDNYRFHSLEDFLTSTQSDIDGQLDDGWGGRFPVKGREIEATILFADITAFSRRTFHLTSTETLVFVNTFFSWITAQALQGGTGIVDKYIGDEVMVIYSTEFGSMDPFQDAIRAGAAMAENDVHDFAPHIGIASGPVTVGYVGTPVKYNVSAFGAPVAMAARCAGVKPGMTDRGAASCCMTFPALDWGSRALDEVLPPTSNKSWDFVASQDVPMKNLPDQAVCQIQRLAGWYPSESADDRAREGVAQLRTDGRYWPRHLSSDTR